MKKYWLRLIHKNNAAVLLAAGLLGLAMLLSVGGVALGASGPAIDWRVIAGGGAPASGGNVTINDSIGQPLIGSSSAGNVGLGSGYWTGFDSDPTAVTLLAFAARASTRAALVWIITGLALTCAAVGLAFKRRRGAPHKR